MLTKLQSCIKIQSPFYYHPETNYTPKEPKMYKGMMQAETNWERILAINKGTLFSSPK
jgi:hypothetical protein